MRLLTEFRAIIQGVLDREVASGRMRDVCILAVDGIPFELARSEWRQARVQPVRTVFPSTSSTAWLSSLTGRTVDSHAVPGVVFSHPTGEELINVYSFNGVDLVPGEIENIFSDAVQRGYRSVSVLGDLEDYPCAWRDALLQHSEYIRGYRFYTSAAPVVTADLVCLELKRALADVRRKETPSLIWCFIEVDRHIHLRGYDQRVHDAMRGIDATAQALSEDGALVVAYSDHGLVATRPCRAIDQALTATLQEHRATLGGAGRTRWIYAPLSVQEKLETALRTRLPSSIRIEPADLHFQPGSAARRRVGDIVLIATGEEFITSAEYAFDHGSLLEQETDVPVACWGI